jgi:hypothetical protein
LKRVARLLFQEPLGAARVLSLDGDRS